MDSGISGVILTYRRRENLARAVPPLAAVVDDLIVWNNAIDCPVQFEDLGLPERDRDRMQIVDSDRNLVTWARYAASSKCRHDLIATQDDDLVVRNWPAILKSAAKHPESLTAAMPWLRVRNRRRNQWGTAEETLLGWGAVFDRRWVDRTFSPYFERYGPTDELLDSKADRLFTILLNRHHNLLSAEFDELPGSRTGDALWRQPDHQQKVARARSRALRLLGIEVPERVERWAKRR